MALEKERDWSVKAADVYASLITSGLVAAGAFADRFINHNDMMKEKVPEIANQLINRYYKNDINTVIKNEIGEWVVQPKFEWQDNIPFHQMLDKFKTWAADVSTGKFDDNGLSGNALHSLDKINALESQAPTTADNIGLLAYQATCVAVVAGVAFYFGRQLLTRPERFKVEEMHYDGQISAQQQSAEQHV